MIYISHRGNLAGPNAHLENHPTYIDEAISRGFDVEVDLWVNELGAHLGHDEPVQPVDKEWFDERITKLWVHCKNPEAIEFAHKNGLHYFYHSIDGYTLTSYGFVWPYPGNKMVTSKCILVLPERIDSTKIDHLTHSGYAGICSDYIESVRNNA